MDKDSNLAEEESNKNEDSKQKEDLKEGILSLIQNKLKKMES
jgi:hypothetical protein